MLVHVLIHGRGMCALLDSGARRNVLPLHHFQSIPTEFRPPLQPSVARVLQGIGPGGLTVLGEDSLPVHIGSKTSNGNSVTANTAESPEVILGRPFLRQARAHLAYGRREATLFGEKVPLLNTRHTTKAHVVRVAHTTVLEPGCQCVVPGTFRLCQATDRDMMLGPKSFMEKHHVLVAGVVVESPQSTNVPIRVFNPGTGPVTLKGGAVAGVLQPAKVLDEVGPQSAGAPPAPMSTNHFSVSVPNHLQVLYAESCANLCEDDRCRPAHLLHSYSEVFSAGPSDLGRSSLVQHGILTTPGPPVKPPPLNSTPLRRPRTVRRAPDLLGDRVSP